MSQNTLRASAIGGITCAGNISWTYTNGQQYTRVDDIDTSNNRWLTSWRIIIDRDEKWKFIVKGTISMRYCSECCDSWHYGVTILADEDVSFRLIVV